MRKFAASVALVALLLGVAGVSTPSRAETGQVAVVFTKGGFIVGVGGGEGVLVLRGKRYPFTVSGMSVGFTIGASTTKFVGRALNLKGPASIEGTYGTIGAGGAVAAGAGGVQLQNANGVILQLSRSRRRNGTFETNLKRSGRAMARPDPLSNVPQRTSTRAIQPGHYSVPCRNASAAGRCPSACACTGSISAGARCSSAVPGVCRRSE